MVVVDDIGSEHIFAKYLETKINIPHGLSILLGILIMSKIQNNQYEMIEKVIKKLNLFQYFQDYKISKKIITKVFYSIEQRKDRFTILDTANYQEFAILSFLDDLEKSLSFKFFIG